MFKALGLKAIGAIFLASAVSLGVPVLSSIAGDEQIEISWQAPSEPVEGVLVEVSSDLGAHWKTAARVSGSDTRALVDGLKNGNQYWFRIHWIQNGRVMPPSDPITSTPIGAPDAPTDLVATPGDGQVALKWSAPDSKGPRITGYVVYQSNDDGDTWKVIKANTKSPGTSFLVDGVENGTSYQFQVAAISINGVTSAPSEATSVLVGTLTNEAISLSIELDKDQAILSWTKPTFDGTLDYFRIELTNDGGDTWNRLDEIEGTTFTAAAQFISDEYAYRVIAVSLLGEVAISNIENVPSYIIDSVLNEDGSITEVGTDPNTLVDENGNPVDANGNPINPADSKFPDAGVETDVNGGVGSRETLPQYDVTSAPKVVVNTTVGALALLGVVSGGAGAALARREDQSASLEGVDAGDLEGIDKSEAWGDRSRTWRIPTEDHAMKADTYFHTVASFFHKVSPLFGRVVTDGNYLSAAFGALAFLTWPIGFLLATTGAIQTTGEALPPLTWTAVAILVLGIFDASAALLAVFVTIFATLTHGGYADIPSIRTTLGLAIFWFAPALIASAARPMRRSVPEDDSKEWWEWERLADFVIGPMLGAWAVRNMVNGLPALAGLKLPIANDANLIAVIAFLAIFLRYFGEELVTRLYPARLKFVESRRLPAHIKGQFHASLVVRTFLFVFVAYPFMGNTWQLWVGALFFTIPSVLSLFEDRFPNYPGLYQVIPSGLPKLLTMLLVGSIYGDWVGHLFSSGQDGARMGFVLLGIPSLVLSILSKFGRHPKEGDVHWYLRPENEAIYRYGGIYVLGLVIYLAWF